MTESELNNRIKEMVIAYSRDANIPYHPEAAINQVKGLIREILDQTIPQKHKGTSEFADGVNMTLVEIALRRKELGIDLTVANGQKLLANSDLDIPVDGLNYYAIHKSPDTVFRNGGEELEVQHGTRD